MQVGSTWRRSFTGSILIAALALSMWGRRHIRSLSTRLLTPRPNQSAPVLHPPSRVGAVGITRTALLSALATTVNGRAQPTTTSTLAATQVPVGQMVAATRDQPSLRLKVRRYPVIPVSVGRGPTSRPRRAVEVRATSSRLHVPHPRRREHRRTIACHNHSRDVTVQQRNV